MSLPDFEALALFAKVVEMRSFTGAARELQLSKATVSKAVDRLENKLGTRLFHRTTRALTLTPAGHMLAERAAAILTAGEEAENAVQAQSATPRGTVHLSVPMSFGVRHIAPIMPAFLKSYPDVQVQLDFSDTRVDLIKDGFDAALRIAALPDSSLVARRIRSVSVYLLASPAAIRQFGKPQHPLELAEKPCLCYTQGHSVLPWHFRRGAENATIRPAGPLHVNNGEAVLAALVAGIGFGTLPDFLCEEALARRELVALFTDWSLPASALHFITPPGIRPARIEVLSQFFYETLKRKRSELSS